MGHATDENTAARISNNVDQTGNEQSDGLADDGVDTIKGEGLVQLGRWIAGRHDDYNKLMRRIHTMIVVTIAEQDGRENTGESRPWF